MINTLRQLLATNSYKAEVNLDAIQHSCCTPCNIQALDFDIIKDDFCQRISVAPLKSVDAIYLSDKTNEIYLIEMKRFTSGGTLTSKDFIDSHFVDNALPNKVIDSIILLSNIVGYHDVTKTFYSYFLNNALLKIRAFLLVNFTSKEYLKLVIASQHQRITSLTKRVESDIRIVNCVDFKRYIDSL